MKISELKPGTGNATVEAKVVSIEEPRDVLTRYGKKTRVARAIIEDDTGQVSLTLWGDEVNAVKEGEHIRIEDGWVSEYMGNLQISTGKYGRLVKL
ncbi:MAG: OB-fold nucleic acid binding domain-containing protein [Candidatus Micrarchaeia archaeon]